MKIFTLFFIVVTLIVSLSSCEEKIEDTQLPSIDIITLPESLIVSKIEFVNLTKGFLCGGQKNEYGSIYMTQDGGENWSKCFASDSLSVNDFYFLNDSVGFACGDSLMLLKTVDGGSNWSIVNLSNYPFEEYKNPYNAVYANSETNIFLVGGEHYNKGIYTETEVGGYPWYHESFDNQFNALCFVDESIGFFGGYGILIVTEDGGNTFDYIEFEGENFVDLEVDNNGAVYAVSDQGYVYYSEDLGYNWSTIVDDFDATFSDLSIGENLSVVCSTNGKVYFSYDETSYWEEFIGVPEQSYYCTFVNSKNEVFLGSDGGKIYILDKKRTP
jgi:photosystem II stability/assembly factor-like uncharacterized protein